MIESSKREKELFIKFTDFLTSNNITYSEFKYIVNETMDNFNIQLLNEEKKLIFKLQDGIKNWNSYKEVNSISIEKNADELNDLRERLNYQQTNCDTVQELP